MAQHLTSENFKEEVLNSNEPVLVDFYATWCGPCKRMAPVLDELEQEMEGAAKVYKVDIDKAGELAQQYRIMSVPTFMVFKNGEIADQVMGAVPKQLLKEKLNNA